MGDFFILTPIIGAQNSFISDSVTNHGHLSGKRPPNEPPKWAIPRRATKAISSSRTFCHGQSIFEGNKLPEHRIAVTNSLLGDKKTNRT